MRYLSLKFSHFVLQSGSIKYKTKTKEEKLNEDVKKIIDKDSLRSFFSKVQLRKSSQNEKEKFSK